MTGTGSTFETPNIFVTESESTRMKSIYIKTFLTARRIHCRQFRQVKCNDVDTRTVPVTIPGYTMGSVGLASLSRVFPRKGSLCALYSQKGGNNPRKGSSTPERGQGRALFPERGQSHLRSSEKVPQQGFISERVHPNLRKGART